jgi:hypothetical protein
MAGSPVAAASLSIPGPQQETESDQGTESELESELETNCERRTDAESEPGSAREPEPETITADANATSGDAGEHGIQDAVSVKTTTANIFPEYGQDAPPGPESKQHKLGLDINEPWGWDGSSYNDYE